MISYADFVRIFDIEDETEFPGFLVKPDGVWVDFPPSDADWLGSEERATLSEHPHEDLSTPALKFPCTTEELRGFLDWSGLLTEETFMDLLTELERDTTRQDKDREQDEFIKALRQGGEREEVIAYRLWQRFKITGFRVSALFYSPERNFPSTLGHDGLKDPGRWGRKFIEKGKKILEKRR